jgi:hypothetical protein
MDFRVYMLLVGLLIAIFGVIGWFVLSASFRAHERRRRSLENRWRLRQRWEAETADGIGQH